MCLPVRNPPFGKGDRGDFAARSSCRRLTQHFYSASKAELYHLHSRWVLKLLSHILYYQDHDAYEERPLSMKGFVVFEAFVVKTLVVSPTAGEITG